MENNFLSVDQIRTLFLDYFHKHHHSIIKTSSLVPQNDPTLLFTNAGMVQFKDFFLGKETRSYTRATSAQRCVRAGGKHNDLERVGYTARHHTFFEMLGNFSFGDYFKHEAIHFAWEFLTKILQLPREKLWVTVFREDEEAANIWLKEIKIDPKRFSRLGEDSNFWSMGSTGPCGPCTELFYDHGEQIPGGPPGSADEDGDRYVEIWNLVFMQYDRSADGTLTPLPKPSVDTGMGLERISAVMQGVHNNYDIDLFQNLIKAIAKLGAIKETTHYSLRVIADHIRSSAFLIADHVLPSNEGRGYVLRRIIRRALRHGHQLNLTQPFFYKLVEPLTKEMGRAYPELQKEENHIKKILQQEEEQFTVTLHQGLKLFEQMLTEVKNKIIPGDVVFKLYDTYGFPADLTADIARERGLTIDYEGFEKWMNRQRERSREASQFEASYSVGANVETPTVFTGYKNLLNETTIETSKIIALYRDDQAVHVLKSGEKGSVILDQTPFYAESGGQVGDQGILQNSDILFHVTDTQKQGQAYVHIGILQKGEIKLGETLFAEVDVKRRSATVLNHSATHLLHDILREVLGTHVVQKGSLVEPERLRFDFSHRSPLTLEEIKIIEQRVNQEIRQNHEAIIKITTPQKAIEEGAMALFEEKYGDQVRVIRFGHSIELCGGTHVHHTGEIGLFKITNECGIASGIRRLEATTGSHALQWLQKYDDDLKQKLHLAEERTHSLEKELEQLKGKLAHHLIHKLIADVREIKGIKILAEQVDLLDTKSLRLAVDQLKNKLNTAIIALAAVKESKISVIVGVTKNLTEKIKAGDIVNHIALQIGGKGGGRPDLAEAGGNQPENLPKALKSIDHFIDKFN